MHKNHSNTSNMSESHYRHLLIMAVLSFISMYILMYAMVNTVDNVFNNFNQFYMAGLMTAPMVLIELFVMRSMFPNKQRNTLIIAVSIVAALVFFLLIRQQAAISDKQFLRSMIPHHAGAILMCEQAPIDDPEIEELCGTITSSQQTEIDQMKAILQRLGQ
jgi:dipeptide/tripeptide permease